MNFQNILFIGCGNMAGAMLEGWLAAGTSPQIFTIFDPADRTYPDGVTALSKLPESGEFDAILLGVKPQILAKIVPDVEPLSGENTAILSLLAGVQLDTLAAQFPRAGAHVRVMPNLAVALGKAPIALAQSGLSQASQDSLMAWMGQLGQPEWVDEDDFDLVTALAGSGPAFVYRFIDALGAGAADLGLDRDQGKRLAIAMVEGAAALAAKSDDSPADLADKVASPGGVTREGMNVLDADQAIFKLMRECLESARDRSMEMAKEARG